MMLLLDTNVWLDYYLPMRAGHEDAKALLDAAFASGAQLLVSAGCLKDFYYLYALCCKRQLKASGRGISEGDAAAIAATAWAVLENLQELAVVVPVGQSDVWLATKQRSIHNDFEDNLLIAAAVRSKADYLVSSDESLLANSPVAALSPKAMLAWLQVNGSDLPVG